MKLRFDPNQDYQLQAIRSIVEVFEGQPLNTGEFEYSVGNAHSSLTLSEYGVGNICHLSESGILENVQRVQHDNGLPVSEKLEGMNFSVEMETGTGKTYVYLRTIFELQKTYGFRKFIIVVPSIAIREGVLSSLNETHEHLLSLYGNVPLSFSVYDSKNLSALRSFASSNSIQILILNIDAFTKDDNIINQIREAGIKPVEFIQRTNPIVILDEPQNMETETRRKAIENLNPLCTLRYSATHQLVYNLVYRLGPVQAYDLGLVKQIEVDDILGEKDFNQPFLRLEGIKSVKTKVTARLTLDITGAKGVLRKTVTVKSGDNLHVISKGREQYQNGYVINEIDVEKGTVEFSNGTCLRIGESQGAHQDDIMKVQIRNTVLEHLRKEKILRQKGIKVLSLFFIDKVKNYRLYENGVAVKGKFAEWFEEAYRTLANREEFAGLIPFPVEKMHDGYFAQDKKGAWKDSSENRETADDSSTYEKIMRGKLKLIEQSEPLRFIFSHSALREGWDNPNIFQLCTLNETKSEMKKRQEIGRGMRLAVDQKGNRVFDKAVNKLTIVANESYEDFARQLQNEIEDDTGEKFEGRIKKKRDRVPVRLKKGYDTDPNFIELWNRIRQKTTYRVEYSSEELIREATKRIQNMEEVQPFRIITRRTQVVMDNSKGIEGKTKSVRFEYPDDHRVEIPDVLGYIQSKTEITRVTIAEILKRSNRLKDCLKNPQMFLDLVVREIKNVLHEFMIEGIKYIKIADEFYEMRIFEEGEIEAYIDNLHKVSKQEKTLYDYIEIDSLSGPEKKFAKDCEENEDMEFFMKLPRRFVIRTPIGDYRPDWALVFKGEKKLYFVAETKSGTHYSDLRNKEAQKLHCGKKHFETFDGVTFKVVTDLKELM